MQRDKQIRVAGRWALAADNLQWVLQRRNGSTWQGIAFVSTTKAIMARCMREKGVAGDVAEKLLDGLPDCFPAPHRAASKAHHERFPSKQALLAADAATYPKAKERAA